MRLTLALLALLAMLACCGSATASLADQKALAERYAPVVRLVHQDEECGPGEPYKPIDVNALFGQPTVALRGPWNPDNLVTIGPTAKELGKGLYDYHLDFPGNALSPGCGYERWARRITAGYKPTLYAHVALDPGHPGQLALQYWFFYVYNAWNNLHEGDWEMIQLNFQARNPHEALSRSPTEVGYSQHEGGERARWGDDKLQLVGGTHPVVYPAAGSHANFYGEGLWLGSSAEQGVGCDNTLGPHDDLRPAIATIPTDPAAARTAFPWIAFQGRWGELQPAFFNGPTGPNLKEQWTMPIQWSDGWRDHSYTVPTATVFGTSATDFFCRAIAVGSRGVVRLASAPLLVAGILAALALVLIILIARATWRPAAGLRVARRRTWGQTVSASLRMYASRVPLFVGMGVVLIPITLLITLLQAAVFRATNVLGIEAGAHVSGVLGFIALAIGTALTLLGLGLVQAATARALVEIDQGRPIGPARAYWLALDSVRPLLAALLVAVAVVSLLASSVYLIPVAVWLAGRLALIAPAVELEELTAFGALRRSNRLVRGRWFKVTSLIVLGGALAVIAGPIIGGLLILGTSLPFWLVNVISGLVYTVAMPLVAITTTYVYFDRLVSVELEPPVETGPLPAEIEMAR